MPTQISGTTGASKVQDGAVVQADLGPNVVGNGPVFRARITSTQTLAVSNTAYDANTINTEDFDTVNAYASSVFTAPIAGYYQLTAWALGQATTSIQLMEIALVSSNGYVAVGSLPYSAAVNFATMQSEVTDIFYLPAGATVKVTYRIVGSGTLTVTNARFSGFLARAA